MPEWTELDHAYHYEGYSCVRGDVSYYQFDSLKRDGLLPGVTYNGYLTLLGQHRRHVNPAEPSRGTQNRSFFAIPNCPSLSLRTSRTLSSVSDLDTQSCSFSTSALIKAGDRTTYPKPDFTDIPKSKWSTHVISHLLDDKFKSELESIIRGLKANTFHAIYVTLFGKGQYYSLGSQFIINNQADLGKIMTHLHNQYELLQNRYDLSPTSRSLVKVRELTGYSSKVNEFFFDRMETYPFTQPHKSSGSIMNEQYYPYIDLSALSINKIEGLQIVEESALHVKFLWVSEGRTYFVEYDKIMRQGTSSNIDRQIPFSDTELSNGLIKRSSQGFEIVSVGFYTRSATGEPISKYYQIDKYTSLGAMLESVFKDVEETGVKYVYVHNWAGFDSLFLLKYLQAHYELNPFTFDGQTLSLRVYKKGAKKLTQPLYTIKDSLKLLPLSQSTLTHSFAVSTQKGIFPHYFDPREHTLDGSINYLGLLPSYEYYEPKRVSPSAYAALAQEYSSQPWDYVKELEKYQMDDCKSLHEVLDKYTTLTYQTLGIDVHQNLSIPGSTYKLWQGLENPKLQSQGHDVYKLPRNVSNIIRDSYYGGHVDVYMPYVESNGNFTWHHYDVNSLYPYAMLNPLPTGKPTYVKYPSWDNNFFGFINCTVTCPDTIPYPTLPIRQDHTVIFPSGTFTGTWFSEELRNAEAKGYKIEASHWGLTFNKTEGLFTTLINTLNKIKVNSSSGPTKNLALRTISKLYMNSLYGYFGLRDTSDTTGYYGEGESEEIHLLYKVKKVIPFEDGSEMITHSRLPILDSIELFDPESKHLKDLEGEEEGLQVNVSIASAITAYSRVLINEYKYQIHARGGKVAYSDTDSLVTNIKLDSSAVSGTELGKMKLENEITRGYYLAPKLYYESIPEGSPVIKSRGYGKPLTESDYEKMYQGETLNLTKDKWFRLSTEHRVQIRTVTLTLRSVMTKREKVYDPTTGAWTNTRPLRLAEAAPITEMLGVIAPEGAPTPLTPPPVTVDRTIINRAVTEVLEAAERRHTEALEAQPMEAKDVRHQEHLEAQERRHSEAMAKQAAQLQANMAKESAAREAKLEEMMAKQASDAAAREEKLEAQAAVMAQDAAKLEERLAKQEAQAAAMAKEAAAREAAVAKQAAAKAKESAAREAAMAKQSAARESKLEAKMAKQSAAREAKMAKQLEKMAKQVEKMNKGAAKMAKQSAAREAKLTKQIAQQAKQIAQQNKQIAQQNKQIAQLQSQNKAILDLLQSQAQQTAPTVKGRGKGKGGKK
nr:2963_t:CDS:2 [Entrophospora candida]